MIVFLELSAFENKVTSVLCNNLGSVIDAICIHAVGSIFFDQAKIMQIQIGQQYFYYLQTFDIQMLK